MEVVRLMERPADLGTFLDGHLAAAFRPARAIVLDDADAEDLVQEAALIAWKRHGSLRDPERLWAWFDRIVINLCRDRLRRRRVGRRATETAWSLAPTSNPGVDSRDDLELDAAVDALDPDHRIVILLRYWQDLTVDAIAARLDIPAGTVKSRLHVALRRIRDQLEASDGRS